MRPSSIQVVSLEDGRGGKEKKKAAPFSQQAEKGNHPKREKRDLRKDYPGKGEGGRREE